MKAHVLAAAAVLVASSQFVLADKDQGPSPTTGKPGLGVSAMGVTTTMVSAPAVNAPNSNAKMVHSTPGVSATVTNSQAANSQPGMVSKNVVTNVADSRPGVASRAPPRHPRPGAGFTTLKPPPQPTSWSTRAISVTT